MENIRYEDVCLRDIKRAFDFDTRYNPKAQGGALPDYRSVMMANVHSLTTSQIILRGLTLIYLCMQPRKTSVAPASKFTVEFFDAQIDGNSFKVSGKSYKQMLVRSKRILRRVSPQTMMPVLCE